VGERKVSTAVPTQYLAHALPGQGVGAVEQLAPPDALSSGVKVIDIGVRADVQRLRRGDNAGSLTTFADPVGPFADGA
jgi:hypothetical protein